MDNIFQNKSAESLGQRIKNGTFWAFIGHGLLQVLSLTAIIVLARLLSPDDFGVVAIAMVVWGMVRLFGDIGIGAKIIQQSDEVDQYANAAFWLNILIASCLFLFTAAIAPFAASFYKNDLVNPILMILGLGFFLNSFGATHSVLLIKEMEFKKKALVDVTVELITKIMTILMAFVGYGVWSLVIPQVLSSPFRVLALWKICPWRPSVEFNFIYWKKIYHYGKYILGTDLLRYISLNGDYMVIGRFLGVFELGLYRFAHMIANYPVENIVWVVGKVCFPAFSKLQNDLARLRETFLKMIKLLSLVSFPLFIGLVGVAHELIPFVFGEKWNNAIIPLQIIVGFTLIRSFVSPSGIIVRALGRPRIEFIFNLAQVPIVLLAIIVGVQFGIIGVAIAVSSVVGIMALWFLKLSVGLVDLRLKDVFRQLYPALLSSLVMLGVVLLVRHGLMGWGYWDYQILLVCIPSGAVVYFATLLMVFRSSFQMLWNIFMEVIGNRVTDLKKVYPAFR